MPKRGEVWWGEEPERKRRPYLILTRNSAIELQCELGPERMAEVCAALDAATEC